jgi:hypothetical protein
MWILANTYRIDTSKIAYVEGTHAGTKDEPCPACTIHFVGGEFLRIKGPEAVIVLDWADEQVTQPVS